MEEQSELLNKMQLRKEEYTIKIRCLELSSKITVESTIGENKYPVNKSLNCEGMIDAAQKLYDFITS
jgi:hypothetical protein